MIGHRFLFPRLAWGSGEDTRPQSLVYAARPRRPAINKRDFGGWPSGLRQRGQALELLTRSLKRRDALLNDKLVHGDIHCVAATIRSMPFEVVIWQAQNIWNDLLRRIDANYWSPRWKEDFKELGQAMNISVDELVIEEGVHAF